MNCKTCGVESKEIATKTTGRGPAGATKCHRLECGHAWHVLTPPAGGPGAENAPQATSCGCGEIVTVNALLAAGRRLTPVEGDTNGDASDEGFRAWAKLVLEALDGIPAESGAPSLARSAATAAKSQTSSTTKKIAELNKLLVRAITAVS